MRDDQADVIVIGGGVAGLAAAVEVARQSARVILLEARQRLGGRIFTVRPRSWPDPVELGAQFVHGGNAEFWEFLGRHGIETQEVPPRHWHSAGGHWTEIDATRRIAAVTRRIKPRQMAGWTFAEFLRRTGSRLNPLDRELAVGFVEGFEAAPCDEMSAVAVAGETLEDDEQFFIPAGYDTVVKALAEELRTARGRVVTAAPCTRLDWHRRHVVVDARGAPFKAAAAIVSLPLGVWQAGRRERGRITFAPSPRRPVAAAARMRMGDVVRISVRLDGRRWPKLMSEASCAAASSGFGFVHAADRIPVWWSLTDAPVVTGWAGGPRATELAAESERGIRRATVAAMSRVFGVQRTSLEAAVLDVALHNWTRDPFTRGAYSFTRAGQECAPAQLRQPVDDTLFFAGEATADGESTGTVHGAFASGRRAAREVMSALA